MAVRLWSRDDSANAWAHGSKSGGTQTEESSAVGEGSFLSSAGGAGRMNSSERVTAENSSESDWGRSGPASADHEADGCKKPKKQAAKAKKPGRIAIVEWK